MVGCAHTFVRPCAPDWRRRRARSCLALAVVKEQTREASLARTALMSLQATFRAVAVLLKTGPDVPQAASTAASMTLLTASLSLLRIVDMIARRATVVDSTRPREGVPLGWASTQECHLNGLETL